MKRLFSFWVVLVVLVSPCLDVYADPYAHIQQDNVQLDLDTGHIFFNGDPVALENLQELLDRSYSVYLSASSFSGECAVVPARNLLAIFEQMDRAEINSKRVRMNLFFPQKLKRNQYHRLTMVGGRKLSIDGTIVSLGSTEQTQLKGNPVVIEAESKTMNVDYRDLYAVLQLCGTEAELAGLKFVDHEKVEVTTIVYQVQEDGSEDVLSAPRLTASPGNEASIKVVENASGYRIYKAEEDAYHQEDLAHLGVRISAKPQIIGDYVRVSGVTILTKMKDRAPVFEDENIPIASYSCSKMVVPFSVVFPPGTDAVQFAVADLDGKETMCRVRATVVDHNGMSKKQREMARQLSERNTSGPVIIKSR